MTRCANPFIFQAFFKNNNYNSFPYLQYRPPAKMFPLSEDTEWTNKSFIAFRLILSLKLAMTVCF